MTKHKVCELEGDLLDAAVAMALVETSDVTVIGDEVHAMWPWPTTGSHRFSQDWTAGGFLIDRKLFIMGPPTPMFGKGYGMMGDDDMEKHQHDFWARCFLGATKNGYGKTQLIANARSLVLSLIGEEIELP